MVSTGDEAMYNHVHLRNLNCQSWESACISMVTLISQTKLKYQVPLPTDIIKSQSKSINLPRCLSLVIWIWL